jgi:hypothetical protein
MVFISQVLLLVGCSIFLFGIVGFFSRSWSPYVKYILLALGMTLLYVTVFGPLSNIENRILAITKIKSNAVESIVLQPTRRNEMMRFSMFEKDSVITDKSSINEMCELLRHSAVMSLKHKKRMPATGYRLQQVCRVEIHFTDNEVVIFGVIRTDNQTTISLNSKGEFGWHYANLSANEWGELLMRYVSKPLENKS